MDSKDTTTTQTKGTVNKAVAKESSAKVSVAKRKYFVPATGKTYEATSLTDATNQAAKELTKEKKK